MLSFQCSRHSTPESIEDVFMDCADIQIRDAARKPFVSVVVLDEIGLAEDSEKMPLKVNNMFDHSVFSVCKNSRKFIITVPARKPLMERVFVQSD